MAATKKALGFDAPTTEDIQASFASAAAPLKAFQEQFRALTEKSLQQAQAQYATVKKAAEEATGTAETSFGAFNKGVVAYNTQALEALRSNANAAFDHLANLQGVKSFAEAIELSASHARNQFDAIVAQGKQLQDLARKAANETAAPVRSAFAAKR